VVVATWLEYRRDCRIVCCFFVCHDSRDALLLVMVEFMMALPWWSFFMFLVVALPLAFKVGMPLRLFVMQ
jgi:hypothetical protein